MYCNLIKRSLATFLGTPIHRLTSPQTDVSLLCWVRSVRKHKERLFIDLSDGLSSHHLQAIVTPSPELADQISAGSSIRIHGDLIESRGRGQKLELVAKDVEVVGKCDNTKYPFRPRKTYLIDHERSLQHFRPRLEKYAAVHRVRNRLVQGIHSYFQELDFCQVQTPILTTNDCEGAGETFVVHHADDLKPNSRTKLTSPSVAEAAAESLVTPGDNLPSPQQQQQQPETRQLPYFATQCHLTVSGQLHLEALVHSISRVYTMQPAFRAENALSRKHLCEFEMLEAELVAESLDAVVSLAEGLIKHVWAAVRQMDEFQTIGHAWRDSVDEALGANFVQLSYDEALRHLEGKPVDPLRWGEDLNNEHEKMLLKLFQGRPVIVTGFPADLKPFYMAVRGGEVSEGDSSRPVADCFDLLLPVCGEVVGGSMREADLTRLQSAIERAGVNGLEWYEQLREFGSIPHGGFGLGVDRLLQYFTNTNNIKDAVPFPRWRHHCQA